LAFALIAAVSVTVGQPTDATAANAERGRLVASGGGGAGAGAACFACHGMDGGGDAGGAFPRLAGLDARYLAKQLENYADGSRPNEIMTPIALALSAEERQAVALHYAGLRLERAQVRPAASVADGRLLQWGATLYAIGSQHKGVQACVNCHGPGGQGLGHVFPAIAGQPAQYTADQLRLWREGVRRNDQAGMMRTIAQRLDDEDMRALGLYLQSLPP
jgi:cytochrome c553